MLETWETVPEYGGRGAPPKLPRPGKDWHYVQIIKKRKGGKLESVRIKVIYGDPEEVKEKLGCHTAYVEQTHLTSRQMNGRLVRKTLSFSKELRFLKAATALEDALYNFTRLVKTLRVELANPTKHARWQQRTPAMATGLTDHCWTPMRAVDHNLGSTAYEHLKGRLPVNWWSSAIVLVVEIMLIGKQVASLEECLPTDYGETTIRQASTLNLRMSSFYLDKNT